MTEGGHYKIATDSDAVPKELFEEEKKKRIEAETTIQLLQNILLERKWKQMKRKLDKNKIYMRIGQAVVIITFNLSLSAALVFSFMQNTIY